MSSPSEAEKNHDDIDDSGGEATAQSVWGRVKRLHDKAKNLFEHDPTVTVVVMTITKGKKKAKATILGPVRAAQTKQTVEKAGAMILKVLDSKEDLTIQREHEVNTSAFEPVEIPFLTAGRERKRKAPERASGRAASKEDSAQPPATHLGNQLPATQPLQAQPPATQPPQTRPPATQPPHALPPATQPLQAQPPATQSPQTQPPATQPPQALPPATQPQPPAAQSPQAQLPPAMQLPTTQAQPSADNNQPAVDLSPSIALSCLLQAGLAILQASNKRETDAKDVSIRIHNLIENKKEDISPVLLEEAQRVKKGLDEVQ